ncbi:flagellar biosynthesis protein FlhF [Helicobacter cappadocius]|uniref:Flagellar biosynthesis protein FlhF n=1 Tax=Helicobacter cappadocius TaxID=3063998 RepID=A0AA90PPW6_9HELI|nr:MULTISPECIES: flagellar biosynthesis protein FlhF [unclassified Helicobacter]MDO7252659.1 flagellar biosynthesis protein FlhF [Helicobacter sp. faydin-H75]MDP2538526.1 flagellar biosynthesis protein FlhF [Helicobacter sp. faydin-H76]
MKLYTYGGETAAQALKTAQSKHGEDALVVKTREIRKKTMTQPGLYEIVVAVENDNQIELAEDEENVQKPKNSIQKRLDEILEKSMDKKKKPIKALDDDVTIQLSDAVREISKIAGMERPAAKAVIVPEVSKSLDLRLENKILQRQEDRAISKQNDTKEFKQLKTELDKINDKIKLIQNMFWDEKGPKNEGLQIPQEFAEIYRIAKNSGMNKIHLDEIMKLSLELMPLKMRENSLTIKRYFREVLRKMIYCRNEHLDAGNKKIIMLVGPTGVGKTTTLAKLAARYSKMMDKKYKVGIITLDTYRIGALEQLTWYARKMKISIETVIEPEDFLKEIDTLRYCDYILVDTAGHSQHDKQKINMLKKFINNDYKIDIALVLSATTKYEDLRDIYQSFGELDIDTLIFSKLDESRGLGSLFSLVYESKKPVSYLSVGQEVPMDLLVATNDYLVDCMLDGFTNPVREVK